MSSKWAKLDVNGFVISMSYDPDRVKVIDYGPVDVPRTDPVTGDVILDENGNPIFDQVVMEIGWHWGEPTEGWVEIPEEVYQGWQLVNGEWIAPPPPPIPVPDLVIDRRFYWQLAIDEYITEQEALDAVGAGVIPAAIDATISTLPTEEQFSIRLKFRALFAYELESQLADIVKTTYSWSDAVRDQFWRDAAALA